MANPGDQDGQRLVAAGSITVPAGAVVVDVECVATAGGAGATVDVSAFEPSKLAVPVGAGADYEDHPDYVGDGAKAITFGGALDVAVVSWKVL